jgi:hypothetical protein
VADLASFLARAGRTPFAYGVHDCCLWLADWLVACGYPDPAAELRGRYSTERGCARLLRRQGGLDAVVGACAKRADLVLAQQPCAGDVGLVLAITPRGPVAVGGLCTGPRWAMLSVGGLIVAPMTALATWSVTCPRP